MAQPPPYDRSYNFHDYQAENPLKPLPAGKLDEEFSRVKKTIDAVLQNLALIQRDDTALANKSVGYDQLKDEIQLGFNPPTDWKAGHNYVARDTVFVDVSIYRCRVSHISSNNFNNDRNAGYWELIVDFASVQTAAIAARDAALQARSGAESARDAAVVARGGAESARDAAIGAKNDAVAAKTASESARDASVVAKGLAEAARGGAESARDAAIGAKNDAVAAKTASESARDDAIGAKNDAVATLAGSIASLAKADSAIQPGDNRLVPAGGTTGQVLVKATNTDHDTTWRNVTEANAGTATKLQTARTLTIGNTGKSFDGSANVSWSLDEIGAAVYSSTVQPDTLHNNTTLPAGFYTTGGGLLQPNGTTTFAPGWHHVIHLRHDHGNGFAAQIAVTLGGNEAIYFRNSSGTAWSPWLEIYHSGNLTGSLSGHGYQKLPGGLIIQWGSGSTAEDGSIAVTFPIAFPTACVGIHGSHVGGGAAFMIEVAGTRSTTGVTTKIFGADGGTGSGWGASWLAIGY